MTGGMVASNTLVRNTVPHTYYMLFAGVYILPCLAVNVVRLYEYVRVCVRHLHEARFMPVHYSHNYYIFIHHKLPNSIILIISLIDHSLLSYNTSVCA